MRSNIISIVAVILLIVHQSCTADMVLDDFTTKSTITERNGFIEVLGKNNQKFHHLGYVSSIEKKPKPHAVLTESTHWWETGLSPDIGIAYYDVSRKAVQIEYIADTPGKRTIVFNHWFAYVRAKNGVDIMFDQGHNILTVPFSVLTRNKADLTRGRAVTIFGPLKLFKISLVDSDADSANNVVPVITWPMHEQFSD